MVEASSLGRNRPQQQLVGGRGALLLHEEPLRNGYRSLNKPPPLKRRRTLPLQQNSPTASGSDQHRDASDGRPSRTKLQQQHSKATIAHGRRITSAGYPIASSSSEYDNPDDDDYTTTNEEAGLANDQPFQPTGSHRRFRVIHRRDVNATASLRAQSDQLPAGKPRTTARTSSNGTRRSNASSNAQNYAPLAASDVSEHCSDDQSWSDHASSSSGSSHISPKPLSPIKGNVIPAKCTNGAKGKKFTQRANGSDLCQRVFAPRHRISPVKLLPSRVQVPPHHRTSNRNFEVHSDFPVKQRFPIHAISESPRQQQRAMFPVASPVRRRNMRMMSERRRSGLSGQMGSSNTMFGLGGKRKRKASAISSSYENEDAHLYAMRGRKADSQHYELDQADLAKLQPLRRTRSVARKMEAFGVPMNENAEVLDNHADVSQQEDDDDDEEVASNDFAVPSTNGDSDDESLERSVAEMSLDEISEVAEGSIAAEPDDNDEYNLHAASSTELHRLLKEDLRRLFSLLPVRDSDDTDAMTKHDLVNHILESRNDPSSAEDEEEIYQSERGSSAEEDDRLPIYVAATRHVTRGSLRDSISDMIPTGPVATSPRRSRRALSRSKSLPNANVEDSDADGDDEQTQTQTSKDGRSWHNRRAGSATFGLSRMSMSSHERTPGRLRSGKLRTSQKNENTEGDEDSNDGDDDDAEEAGDRTQIIEDEDDVPTPIARRTRHRRHASLANSISSAGGEDEEEDPHHHQYRLRRVSMSQRGKRDSMPPTAFSDDGDLDEAQGNVSVEHQAEDVDDLDEDDELDQDAAYDLASATQTSLLRLRRGDLLRLCSERNLPEEGTKKDLAAALLEWRDIREAEEAAAAPTSTVGDDDEQDENGPPASDVSMQSVIPDDESQDDDEQISNHRMSAVANKDSSGKETGLNSSRRRARRETKTQALAKLSNKKQSYDPESQEKPLLERSHQEKLIHSPKVDTPPGSGDDKDNDLELDLAELNLQDKEIPPEELERGQKIGSGGFKDVYEGKYRKIRVALADIRGHITENDLKELRLLGDLKHDNIVRFIGIALNDSRDIPVTIVSELCTNGDLFDYIRNVEPPPFDKVLSIMLNIAKGINYLHQRKPAIIHRDLKSSNVLITAKGVAKVTDFGLARVRNSTRSIIKSLVGTVNWQAPELWVAHPRYNEKVDVFSAALVYWECLQWHHQTKRFPFEGMNEHAIYQDVGQKQNRPATAPLRRQWGSDIVDLIEQMWTQDPKQRPNFSEVVQELEHQLKAEKVRMRAAR